MKRNLAFAGLVFVCVLFTALYILRFRRAAPQPGAGAAAVVAPLDTLQAALRRPHVFFRSTRQDDAYGRMVVAPLDDPTGPRLTTPLSCDRLDVSGGTGVCLTATRGVLTTYAAVIFDTASFAPRSTITLGGIPSRVRVSPDGALAGITVFVSGHGYSQSSFSTQTTLVDTKSGAVLADLETFDVVRDGKRFRQQDFNFWGVTFARDSNTFYATVSSGGDYFLIRGDAKARRAEVIGSGVECPALSPDNTRLAFKKRQTERGQLIWRLAVWELSSGTFRVLPGETRSVDDQPEWLDDSRILYSLPDPTTPGSMLVSVVPDGDGPSSAFVAGAYSPSIP